MKRTFLILILLLFAPIAQAAVYHIDPTVGTSGTGTAPSPFKAWTNLPSMSTSDDVYIKCGTTLTPSTYLNITWQGTSSDPVVIGAYWMDGATARYEVNGDRPIISGSDWTVPINGYYGASDSWGGLILVNSKDYITIQDLHIYRAGWDGIQINGDTDADTNSAYFVVQRCKIEASFNGNLNVNENKLSYGLIDDVESTLNSIGFYLGYRATWPQSISLHHCPFSYITVKNCYVHHNFGEGIGSTHPNTQASSLDSGYATIENNLIWMNRRVDIYLGRTEHNIVRNNLCLAGGNAEIASFKAEYPRSENYWTSSDGRYWGSAGVHIGCEAWGTGDGSSYCNNNQIYNNLIAGHYLGIHYFSMYTTGTMTFENNWIYNNTIIGARFGISLGAKLSKYALPGNAIKNNIIWIPSDTIGSNITGDASWIDSTPLVMDYNSWTGSSPTYAGGANDVNLAATDANFEKTSGWQTLSDVIGSENFQLKSTSSLIDQGADLSTVFTTDYFAETRPASWDIGADEYISPGGLPSNTATAHYMSSAPTIDGTLTEWASLTGFTLTDATTGKTGTYKIAFDSTYLYLSGSVTDTTLNSTRTTRDSDIYNDDSFELVLGSAITTDDNKATTDHKLILNIGGYSSDSVGLGTTLWDNSWTPTISQAFVNTGTLNDANSDTGYTFEARISWSDLGVSAPSDDDIWQFDFNQNDRNDDDARTYEWFWNSDDGNFNNPLGWGRLLFDIPTGGGSTLGIISLYDFESGALTTDSVGTNTLTNNATITESTDARRGSGSADLEASSSQYFSRTDADLSSGFPGKSGETNKDFTIGGWFKSESFAALPSGIALLSKYNGTTNDRSWHLSVREVSTGSGTYAVKAQIGFNSGTEAEDIAHASTLSTGTWYFAAMTFDSATNGYAIRLRDSQCQEVGTDLEGTATLDANGLSITDADFKIGALGATTQYFDGLIDYAFVYNEPLSEADINALCGTTRRSRGAAMMMGW